MERDHKRGGPLESSHPTCRAIMRVHHVKVALLERLLHLSPEPDVTTKDAGSYLCYHVAVNTTASKRLYLVLHECAIVWALGGRPSGLPWRWHCTWRLPSARAGTAGEPLAWNSPFEMLCRAGWRVSRQCAARSS